MRFLSLKRPFLMIMLINLMGFGILSLQKGFFNRKVLILGALVSVLIGISYFIIAKMSVQDVFIFLIVSMLFSVGLIMIHRINPAFAKKQFIWLIISLVGFFVVYFTILKLNIWNKLHYMYFLAILGLFAVTLVLGTEEGGAKNWIFIGSFSIQPSEIIKVLTVFVMADRYAYPDKYRFKNLDPDIVLSVLVYTVLGLFVIQREWGTAVLVFGIHISMMYIFSGKFLVMLANIGLALSGGYLGVKFVPHIQKRIEIWLNPSLSSGELGGQVLQSLFAISSGGFFGTGIGLGRPYDIPVAATDAIFPAICEEFGILGGVAIIMLYFLLVYRGVRIAMQIENTFYKCLVSGLSIMFGYQTFIIIGGITKLIPLTGITLPFISYGGSSLVISFVAIAVIEAAANKINSPVEEVAVYEEERC